MLAQSELSLALTGVPFTEASFTIAARAHWKGHAHSCWHLLEVVSGSFEENDQGEGLRIDRGKWRLSPASLAHEIIASDETKCRNIHIHDARLARRLGARLAKTNHVISVDRISAGQCRELNTFETVANACRAAQTGGAGTPPQWLIEARQCVLNSRAPIADIARQFLVAREHFARAFDEYFGCAPKQARQVLVLDRVCRRLIETDEAISAIAYDEGFYDQAHMTIAVKRKYGAPPASIRAALYTSHSSNTKRSTSA